ncbi:ABC transporter ATP-binding protein [Deefgea rivuli]|uniref:ABC transporter ATP-binding protein n=1 Tax=Deefgea rivuli TaxID=400948 RepID=UPI0004821E21|nr:ABC transporter ATP-binding protein [Deefgea rivuli]
MLRFFENLVHPYPSQNGENLPRHFTQFIWRCTQGLRPLIFGMMLCTAIIGSFEAILYSLLGHLIDWLSHIEPSQLWQQEKPRLYLIAGVLLFSPIIVGLQTLLKHQALAGNFPMLLRWNFHRQMLAQSMSFYQDEFAGRVSAKVMQTALAVRETVFIVTDIMVFVAIYFFTMLAVAGSFDLWLLAPLLGWMLLYILAMCYFVPRLGTAAKNQADARSLMTGRITDAYTNIATVKLFSHGRREAAFARSAMQEFMHTVNGQMRLVSQFEVVNHSLSVLLILASAATALHLWSLGQITAGAVAASLAMALRLNGMSQWIMWEVAALFEHIGTVQDGINTLTTPHQVLDTPNAPAIEVPRGEVRFEQVDFGYDSERLLLENLSLHIQAGEKIGLVGRSGAGKSTIVNLLLRFYDIQQGQILIDGQNIAHVQQDSLRAHIGMVTQDTSLLHRSVRENIMYGRPDASDADMIAAAKRAEAHEFILNLSDPAGRTGYDAHVGERGVKLSGGQRQRIAIARVMLKDAPILLLDEATSALDSEVEAAIQTSLYRLMEGKTVVAIAHRLSTIAAMDRLIVLDQGRVVEQGNHQELLEHGGLYARLWSHQSGGFLGEED